MNISNWQWFKVGKIFSLQKCKCSNATDLLEEGEDIAYIGAKKSENGVMKYVKKVDHLITPGNCIVFIGDGQGSVGYCIYQPVDFIGSTTLIAGYNKHINPYIAAFLISILDKERYRYSFGRKYKKEVIENSKILLPAIWNQNEDWQPDWQYMENYVKEKIIPQLPKKSLHIWQKQYDISPVKDLELVLNSDNWKKYKLTKLFEVSLTKGDIKADEVECGSTPLISSGGSNNGIVKYITENGDGKAETFPPNTITLDMFCHACYHSYKYYAVGHGRVNILKPKFQLNRYIGIFVCTILNREAYRFSYGRAVYSSVAENIEIRLPVTPTGEPDWQFMEDYIKSLPYSRNIESTDPNELVNALQKKVKELEQQLQQQSHPQTPFTNYGTVNIIDNSRNYNIK